MAIRARRRRRTRYAFDFLEDRIAPAYDLGIGLALGTWSSPGNLAPVDIKTNDSAIDSLGNVYCVGTWRGQLLLTSPGATHTDQVISTGFHDGFIAKFSPTGLYLNSAWWNGKTGTSSFQPRAVAIDPAGNLIVAGSFEGKVNLDPLVTNNPNPLTAYNSPSRADPFVVKLNTNFGFVWGKTGTGVTSTTDEVDAVAVDGLGNIAVTGQFQTSLTFGAKTLISLANSESFVNEYDASGNLLWSQQTMGTNPNQAGGLGLAFDPSGNVLTTGFFAGPTTFSPGVTTNLVGSGGRDIYVAKYNKVDGSVVWAVGIGGSDFDQGGAVASDSAGNAYVTGSYTGAVNFGTLANPVSLTATGVYDAFVAKLDSGGRTVWAQGLYESASSVGQGNGLVVTPAGWVVASGLFSGTMSVATGANPIVLQSTVANTTDAFLVSFDTSGQPLSARNLGGVASDAAFGLGVNALGGLSLAGNFAQSAVGIVETSGYTYEALSFVSTYTFTSSPGPGSLVLIGGTGPSNRSINTITATFLASPVSALDTIELFRDGSRVGSRVGNGNLVDNGPISEGTHAYQWHEIKANGDRSVWSSLFTVQVDRTPPATPSTPQLLAADDTGLQGDNITAIRSPRLFGTAEPNSTLQLSLAGTVIGSTVTDSLGNYTVQPAAPLGNGTYLLTVVATDQAGNSSGASNGLTLKIQTMVLAAPTAPQLLIADDSGPTGDGITNIRMPRFIGTTSGSLTVQLYNSVTSTLLGSTTADALGNYQVQPTNPLADGTYSLATRSVDALLNSSSLSSATSLSILGTPPAAPSSAPSLVSADDSGTLGDRITNNRKPRLIGSATNGLAAQLVDASTMNVLGSSTVTAGSYTLQSLTPLPSGTNSLAIRLVDVAGNISGVSPILLITIQFTPPPAPGALTLLASDDSGTVGDNITNVTSPRLTGVSTATGTLQLVDVDQGFVIGSITVTTGNVFQVNPANALGNRSYHLAVRFIDVAGNPSGLSQSLALTILSGTPQTPPAPTIFGPDDTGIKGDLTTTVHRPLLIGAGAAGQQFDLVDDLGNMLATTLISVGSTSYALKWNFDPGLGTRSVHTRLTDVAGNVSQPSPAALIKIIEVSNDFDGDGKTDLTVFRPSTAQWLIQNSGGGGLVVSYGAPNLYDIPVSADFDGDGKADLAVFRPSTTQWLIQYSSGGGKVVSFGAPNLYDIPVPADYDGDGKADLAVFRPSTGEWLIQYSGGGGKVVSFGAPNYFDIPVPADYDGDGKADLAVFRPSTGQWLIQYSGGGGKVVSFGAANLFDIPAPGDYDGDGKADLAVFRPSTAQWLIQYSGGGQAAVTFGAPNLFDAPIPGPATTLKAAGRLPVSSTQVARVVQGRLAANPVEIPTAMSAPPITTTPKASSAFVKARQWPAHVKFDTLTTSKIGKPLMNRRMMAVPVLSANSSTFVI